MRYIHYSVIFLCLGSLISAQSETPSNNGPFAKKGDQGQDDPFAQWEEDQRQGGVVPSQPTPQIDQEKINRALLATTTFTVVGLDGIESEGSGFILNDGDASYIYTNAHVIDRAEKISIFGYDGRPIKDMLWIEAFDRPFGKFDGFDGGDGVRIRLKEKRSYGLSLSNDWRELAIGRNVALLGDNNGSSDGSKKIEVLPGVIMSLKNGTIQYSCNSRSGSSGGAVIDMETGNVIALNTLGFKLSDDFYTRALELKLNRGKGWGTILRDVKWQQYKLGDYMKQGRVLMDMRDNLEVMILLSYLTPTGHGIYAHWDQHFAGDMSLGDALRKHQNNHVVKSLIKLSAQLQKKAESNIKTSNVDLYKMYIKSLDSVSFRHSNLSRMLDQGRMSYYYTEYAENRHLIAVANSYHKSLGDCNTWFKRKIGVGGTITLGEWETLPPFGQRLAANIEHKILNE